MPLLGSHKMCKDGKMHTLSHHSMCIDWFPRVPLIIDYGIYNIIICGIMEHSFTVITQLFEVVSFIKMDEMY